MGNGKLLAGDGSPVRLRGLRLVELSDEKASGHWNSAYLKNARSRGAEVVRLPATPKTFTGNPTQSLADLDDAVPWAKQNDPYLIIDYHVIGNLPDQLFIYDSTATTPEELHGFWSTVAPRYAQEPAVAFYEIYNEPAALEFKGGTDSASAMSEHSNTAVVLFHRSH